jgi:hypothetical protein
MQSLQSSVAMVDSVAVTGFCSRVPLLLGSGSCWRPADEQRKREGRHRFFEPEQEICIAATIKGHLYIQFLLASPSLILLFLPPLFSQPSHSPIHTFVLSNPHLVLSAPLLTW